MANQNKTVLKTYFQTGDVPVEAEFVNLIDSLRLDPVTPTAHASTGTVTLTFDQDKIYPDVTQTGNITLAVAGSGNVRGVTQELTIIGDNTSTLTLPASYSSGNGTAFNNTKINDIFIEYKTPSRILYNILLSSGIDSTPPNYNIQSVTGLSSTTATFNVQINEVGYVRWMLTTSATAPSKPAILAGTGAAVSNFGSLSMTANLTNSASLSGLTASTTYYLWSYAEDLVPNQTSVQTAINFSTTSVGFNTKSLDETTSNILTSTTNPTNVSFATGSGGTDSPFSVSYWVYQTVAANGQVVQLAHTSITGLYQYNITNSNTFIVAYLHTDVSNYMGTYTSIGATMNGWSLITITYSGSKTNAGVKIYKNATLLSTSNDNLGTYTGGAAVTSSFRLNIAGTPLVPASVFNKGFLDEIAIFNKELSLSEITAIYNGGTPNNLLSQSFASNVKSYYRFEDNLNDSGTNGYNLTPTGTTVYSITKP